jgi:hypothetical protein
MFFHFLGLISLFGAFVIYPRIGARLRATATVSEARSTRARSRIGSPIARTEPSSTAYTPATRATIEAPTRI